jgi:hypothetical protein
VYSPGSITKHSVFVFSLPFYSDTLFIRRDTKYIQYSYTIDDGIIVHDDDTNDDRRDNRSMAQLISNGVAAAA